MKLKDRVKRLEAQAIHQEVIEFAFKSRNESDEDAIKKAKMRFPQANKFIVVSWINPNETIN